MRRDDVERARRVLRERWWLVLVVLLAFVSVAAAADLRAPKLYTGTAEISVVPAGRRAPLAGVRPLEAPTSDELGSRVARILRRRPTVLEVNERLRGTPYQASTATLRPSSVEGWIRIVALGSDADSAARVATEYARVVADEISREDRARLDGVVKSLRSERRVLNRQARRGRGAGGYALAALVETDRQIQRLRVLRRVGRTARVVVPADAREAEALPRGERTLGSALLGLSLGLVAAFVADALGRRPRNPRRLAEAAGCPVVGYVPRRQRDADAAYDAIRAVVDAAIEGDRAPVVVVTGADPHHPTSGLAYGIAGSAVRDRRRVSLMSSAVRMPPPDVGLEPLADVDTATIRAAELGSQRDLVVVDAPPALGSALPRAVAGVAGLVLVVARAGRATVDDVSAAVTAFGPTGADVRLVITHVAPADATRPAEAEEPVDERVPARSPA